MTREVFDYLERRVSSGRAGEIREHLERCADCRATYAAAERLHADVLESDARHLTPERLVALADAAAAAGRRDERDHLASCVLCREQLEFIRAVPPPPELATEIASAGAGAPEPATTAAAPEAAVDAEAEATAQARWAPPAPRAPRPASWLAGVVDLAARVPRWSWGWGSAVAAAAAVLLVVSLQQPPDHPGLAGLARVAPLEVQWPRGGPGGSEGPERFEGPGGGAAAQAFTASYRRGLELYTTGDYGRAEVHLTRAADLDPGHADVFLLLGSCRLLQGRPQAATSALERAVDNAVDEVLAEESRWQLANALLAGGEAGAARTLLQGLVASNLSRAADAADLLQELDAARGGAR